MILKLNSANFWKEKSPIGIPEKPEGNDNEKLLEDKKSIENILEAINIKSEVGEYKFRRIKAKNSIPKETQIGT